MPAVSGPRVSIAMAVGDTPDTIYAEPTTWTGSIKCSCNICEIWQWRWRRLFQTQDSCKFDRPAWSYYASWNRQATSNQEMFEIFCVEKGRRRPESDCGSRRKRAIF